MSEKCILIADDCEKTRNDISDALKQSNYEILTVRGGQEALETLKNRQVDLIITELTIPKMTGINLLREAKLLTPHVGVIVITNYGEVESSLESMNHGAFEYLTKPIKTVELKRVIDCFFQ